MAKFADWAVHAGMQRRTRGQLEILALASAAAVVGASGFTVQVVFAQPSTLKYVLSVAGPASVALLALSSRPLRLLVGAAILVAPFDFVATVKGVAITPLHAVLLLALPLALVSARPGRAGTLGLATAAACLLLVPAIVSGNAPARYSILVMATVASGWVAYVVVRERGGLEFVVGAVVVSAGIQGVLATYEYRTGHQLSLYQQSGIGAAPVNYFFSYGSEIRPSGALPDPIGLGHVLALAVPLTVGYAAAARNAVKRWGATALGAMSLLGLILSYSRMSWVGAVVGVAVTIALLPRPHRGATALGVATLLAVVLAIGLSFGGAPLQRRLNSVLNPTSSTYGTTALGDRLRVRIWGASLRAAGQHPVAGTGFGRLVAALDTNGVSIANAAHAHNTYLQFFGEGGLLGLGALLLWVGSAARDVRRALHHHRVFAAGAAGGLAATLTAWTTDVEVRYLQVSAMVAVLLAIIAAAAAPRQTRLRTTPGSDAHPAGPRDDATPQSQR